ncbi:MAG TPA: hypothetical protein VLY63_00200 [Anaerolineae bacterium]|nr:hypothetical protein [Anaerolineae bacterium]
MSSVGGSEKRVAAVLLGLALVYFLAFALPNSTGADDTSMISIFEPDEFAQYTVLKKMLSFDPGDLKGNVYNFVAYGHYYYGYPFYLGSATLLLPLRLWEGLTNKNSQMPMLLLRQFISVLPMLGAVLVMTYAQTRFRSLLWSLLTMTLLLAIPAVVENNMWWHTESLVTLFVILTIFFLAEDDLKFGRNFLLAAIACGLATATKVLGLFFVLAIPVYLVLGVIRGGHPWKQAAVKALHFVGLMAMTIVVANPFLLIPAQAGEMVRILSGQSNAMSVGWVLRYAKGPESWLPILTGSYGIPLFLAVALLVLLAVAFRKGPRQVLHVTILCWIAPLALYILYAIAIKPTHFFLPIILPLASCVPAALQDWMADRRGRRRTSDQGGWWSRAAVFLVTAGALVLQMAWSADVDARLYSAVASREVTEPRVAYFAVLNERYLGAIPEERALLVYRDVRMYFPQTKNRRVRTFFNTTTYAAIERIQPDLIVLWPQRIADYTQDGAAQRAITSETFGEIQRFFADARAGQVAGYQLLFQDEAGLALVKDEIYTAYFAHPAK